MTSIHEPVFDESFAVPDFTDQLTRFVLPLATEAKIRRVALGITLNPNDGCATTIATGVAGVDGGPCGPCGPWPWGTGTVTLMVMLLQFTEARLQVSVPLPARFRLATAPPLVPELTVK